MKKYCIASVLLVCAFSLGGCASYKGGAVGLRTASEYYNSQEKGGVAIGSEAVAVEAKIKELFYVNLSEKGYYPVQISVRNNGERRQLIVKDLIELKVASGTTFRPIAVSSMIDDFEKNKMTYALLGFGIFSYMSADDANKKMAADWTSKELPKEVIINQNRDVSGFIYLKLPQGVTPKGNTLSVRVESLESKDVQVFDLVL